MKNKVKNEWEEFKLGELVEISSSKRIFAKEYKDEGVPFYRSKEIIQKNFGSDVTNELFISEERFLEIENKFGAPKEGDILLTSVGTLGVPYLVKKEKFYFKDGNLTWFKNFKSDIYSNFLYYWLISPYGKNQILNKAIGSTQKALTINTLKGFEIKLPPQEEQKKIAAILKSLDDKIELNNQMNKTLENMAQTIFKEWFVNFNFPNEEGKPYKDNGGKMVESELGMIPEGWKINKLESFILDTIGGEWGKEQQDEKHIVPIYSIRGTDIPQIKKGNRGNTPKRFIKEASFDKKHLKRGDLIIEISGGSPTQSTGRVSYISKEILEKFSGILTCTNFCRSIRLKETKDSNLIYQVLERLYRNDVFFQYENGTTGIKNLDLKSVFSSEKIAYPNDLKVINNFNYMIDGLYKTIQEKGNQNESLIKIRDILLPKLMSGEIKV